MNEHDWEILKQDIQPRKRQSTWLITFTDIITLVLAFFVLLYSMKETKQDNASQVPAALVGEVGSGYGGKGLSGPDDKTGIERIQIQQVQKTFALNYLEALFKMILEKDPFLSKTTYHREGSQLVLSFNFEDMMNQQNKEGEVSLGMLVNALGRMENKIEILTFIQNQDDWRKSMDLSQSVAKILENSGYNRDILISVYGGSQNPSSSDAFQPGTINLLISE